MGSFVYGITQFWLHRGFYSSAKLNFCPSYGQKTVFANFDQAPLKNKYIDEELTSWNNFLTSLYNNLCSINVKSFGFLPLLLTEIYLKSLKNDITYVTT